MGKVFFTVGMSLDGYVAGPDNPMGDGGFGIHTWVYRTATFRERLQLPGGGVRLFDDLPDAPGLKQETTGLVSHLAYRVAA